jgi:Rrf2 family protein
VIRAHRDWREIPLRISAKADYAVRAATELAALEGDGLVKGERIAQAQGIPLKFLLNIMTDLRHARIVRSHRGQEGGFRLARPPGEITLAEVIRAVEGSLTRVQESLPEEVTYAGSARALKDVWLAVQGALDDLLEQVTLADVASASLPEAVRSHLLPGPAVRI